VIVSINQPAYLPWLGSLERIALSDMHVVLDHVQFEKNGLTNRNRVRTAEGSTWLTVPVRTKGRFGHLAIDQVQIDDGRDWKGKHWRTLQLNYAKAAHFDGYAAYWKLVYERDWTRLIDLLHETLEWTLDAFGIGTRLIRSSALPVRGAKGELVLDICTHLGATTYLSGPLGRAYLDQVRFRDAGLELTFHEHTPPEYLQSHEGFESGLAAIDALFNLGPRARELLAA
jgi:WbqC-like protein family